MTQRTKTNKIAFIALLSAFSSFSYNGALASAPYNTQSIGTSYSIFTSAGIAGQAANAVSAGGVARLLNLAGRGIAQAVGSIDLAALKATAPVAAPAWSPETTASIKPATRPSIAARPDNNGVFGSVAIPFKRLAALKKLAPSIDEMTSGTAISCGAGKCTDTVTTIKAALAKTSEASLRDKMNTVNATINRTIRYVGDTENSSEADYWATPSETLKRQEGDCEDFAILKMAALYAQGVDPKDMAIVVLYDQKRKFYHAILSVSAGGNRYVLDNMRDTVLTDSRLPDYKPLYSIANGKGYLHGSRAGNNQMASAMPLEKIAPGEGVAF